MVLQAVYQGTPLTLCNMYVPNVLQITFLKSLFTKLSNIPPSTLIVGGDFNVPFSEFIIQRRILGTAKYHMNRGVINVPKPYTVYTRV